MSTQPSQVMSDKPTLAAHYIPAHAHQVLATVEQIAASGLLGGGPRLEAILRYIVREELEGRGERLKAFTIATDVLGRSADFDPAADSIVRVEMGRLRKALDHFAAAEGAGNPVTIQIEKGGYRPRFQFSRSAPERNRLPTAWLIALTAMLLLNALLVFLLVSRTPIGTVSSAQTNPAQTSPAAPQAAAPAPPSVPAIPASQEQADAHVQPQPDVASRAAPEILLLPVYNAGPAEWVSAARQLRFDLSNYITRQPWVSVQLVESNPVAIERARARGADPTYVLEGDLVSEEGSIKLLMSLLEAPSMRVIWTRSYLIPSERAAIQPSVNLVARSIASDVAVVNGAIGQAEIERRAGRDPVVQSEQRCLLQARAYWSDYSTAKRWAAQGCLQAALTMNPVFADGLAALALLRLDDARSSPEPERAQYIDHAARLARQAIDGKRSASTLPEAAALAVAACRGDQGEVRRLANEIMSLRPTSASYLRDIANKVALVAGDWQQADDWIRKAGELNDTQNTPAAALAPVVQSILEQDFARAARALHAVPQHEFAIGHVLRRAVGRATSDYEMQSSSEVALERLGLGDMAQQIALVRAQCWLPAIREAVVDFVGRH